MNKKNEILLLLTDRWCDWEASYAIAVANVFSDYVVKTIALNTSPKVSMGNLCVNIDYSIDDYLNFPILQLLFYLVVFLGKKMTTIKLRSLSEEFQMPAFL